MSDTQQVATAQTVSPVDSPTDSAAKACDNKPALVTFPEEVHKRIAFFCDVPSALNLTLTCEAMRPIGESRIWRHLEIREPFHTWSYDPSNQPAEDETDKSDFDRFQSDWKKGPAFIIPCGLSQRKERVGYVRSARLSIFDRDEDRTAQLLGVIQHSVVCLSLRDYTRRVPWTPLKQLFETLDPTCRFNVLTRLSFHSLGYFNAVVGEDILAIASRTPHLNFLSLEFDSMEGEVVDSRQADRKLDWKNMLPNVTHLRIKTGPLTDRVTELIKCVPNLTTLMVSGSGRNTTLSIENVLNGVRSLKHLEKLEWGLPSHKVLSKLAAEGGFEALKKVHFSYGIRDERKERLEFIHIPRIPSIEQIYISSRPRFIRTIFDHSDPANLSPPGETVRIRQKIGIRLLFASHLKIVQLGDGTGFDDPAAWGTKGYEHVRGALIRTYTNGLHTLTHIRLFSRARFHGLTRDPNKWKEVLRSEYKGDGKRWWEEYQCQEKAEWEEATELGGFRVPAGVTFAAAKQDWLWTTPGRRLSLPDEVWKELGAWLSERQEARYKRDMESRERLVMGNFNALRIER